MTKLSIEIDGEKISWEVPEEDLSTLELISGFYNMMLGQHFTEESILAGMAKFINEESTNFSYEDLLETGQYYCNRYEN